MGLLSALVLTICAALSFAYDHDDYQQAIERWNSTAWISTDGKTLYLPDDPRRATLPYADKYCSFHERWATAFTMLSISLVLVVVLSAAISQASFREPQARKLEPATLVRWWAFMRFLMYSFVTLVIGIIQTCLTINSQLLLFLPRARLVLIPSAKGSSTCLRGKTRAWTIQIPPTLPTCVPLACRRLEPVQCL